MRMTDLHPSVIDGGSLSPENITRKLAEGYSIRIDPPPEPKTLDYTGDEEEDPVCWEIIRLFNPPDFDQSFESIMCDTLQTAARFIEQQPCWCTDQDFEHPEHEVWEERGACGRCKVLGRVKNEPVSR